ncbi:hypothetical protein MVEN_00174800 [Mycena venus]|uniref:Uncharacterized protein n=1 Tax=Mycena venus TaxID=2733690 RepID=A0A8H7DEF5_9AGAR|nr:hypothetical protein MVEN_00174800 [Mycena venus]
MDSSSAPLLYPIADPGYESDTGERDNPTLADFEAKTQVTQVVGLLPRRKRALNRKGRAICRIMHATGHWSCKAIAYIFRISEPSIHKVVKNTDYNPRDRVSEDADRAGPEFCGNLPPPPSDEFLKVLLLRATSHMPKVFEPNPTLYVDISDEEDELQYPDDDERPQKKKRKYNSRIREVADGDDEAGVYGQCIHYWRSPSLSLAGYALDAAKAVPRRGPSPVYTNSHSNHTGKLTSMPLLLMLIVGQNVLTGSPAKKPRYNGDSSVTQSTESTSNLVSSGRGSSSSYSPNTQNNSHPGLSHTPVQVQGSSPSLRSMLPPPTPNGHLPLPHVNGTPQTSNTDLPTFLKSLSTVDFTPYLELLRAQGFTVSRLRSVATWTPNEIHETLSRLLMGSAAAAVGQSGMKAIPVLNFEIGLRRLKDKGPAPLGQSLLPPPSVNAANSGTTLPVFLRNVMGFNLSVHHVFVEDQGLGIATLASACGWDRELLQEVLKKGLCEPMNDVEREASGVLPEKKGMTGLEVIALELCIRRAAAAV